MIKSQVYEESTAIGSQKMQSKGKKEEQSEDLVKLFKQFLTISKKQLRISESIEKSQFELDVDPRDRKIEICLPDDEGELSRGSLENYLTKLCRIVWSRAFYYYSTDQLSYEYTKIYSSQQILENLARLSERYRLQPAHFQIINSHLQHKILEYMVNKYPTTLSQEVNRNLNAVVREIDNTDQLMNDYLYNSEIVFKFRDSGEYNDLIMRSINEVLRKIEKRVRSKSIYEKFEEKMERVFESVFDEDWMKESDDKTEIDQYDSCQRLNTPPLMTPLVAKNSAMEQQMKKQSQKQKEKDKERYRTKVSEYTNYKIGRKLPESTRLFTEEEILSHNIKIESPQILRLLTKWCYQLQKKFTTANYFQHYIETLKLENGKFIILVLNQMRVNLDKLMTEEQQHIKKEMEELAKNNYFMQSQLLLRELISSPYEIEKYERISARYAIDVVNNLHSYIIFYLNRLIHGLLTVAIKFTKLPNVSYFEWPANVNLITFQIRDLLRCKCASGEKEIMKIYKQVLKMGESQNMKLVRVVNRFKKGTHDILINVRYYEVLCEIQLSINMKNNRFIEYSNTFNHYLYEMKRSIFGPLTELCSIWKCLDIRYNFYKSLPAADKTQLIVPHICQAQNQFEQYSKPFLCSNCQVHYYHNNYIKQHLKCKQCNYWICAKCQIQSSDCRSLLSAAYKNLEILKKCSRLKSKTSPIPDYGICIYIESQQIKVEPYRKYSFANIIKIIGTKNRTLYQIWDISNDEKEISFREKFLIFELDEHFGRKHIKIEDEKIRDFLLQQKLKGIYHKNHQKICLNYQNLTNDQFSRLSELGNSEQKMNIKKIEMMGNKLQNVNSLVQQFKNLSSLEISKNNIISFEGLDKLKKLQKLYINENRIKKFPKEIYQLQNLVELSFCENQITELPHGICNLHKLRSLKLSNNKIEEMPEWLNELFSLSELNLKNNLIKSLPIYSGFLSELEILELQNNYITNIHGNIGQLSKLQNINLSHNQIGFLPNQFGGLKSLSICNLRNNKLQFVGEYLNQLENLTHLDISNNELAKFPTLKTLNKLKYLNLNNNSLNDLASFEQSMNELKYLSISNNSLKQLPSFERLINLQELHADNNQLQILPDSLGRCPRLQILHLQHNNLTNICELHLEKLRHLNISHNTIVSFINMDLRCLEDLNLMNNDIIAFSWNLMPALKRINFNNNKLDSLELANYPKIRYISASNNKLTSFPEISDRNRIKVINIDHNYIKSFNNCLNNMKSLTQMNISNNLLSKLPKQLQNLSSLHDRSLELHHNAIETVECWNYLDRKASFFTLQEIDHLRNGYGIMKDTNRMASKESMKSSHSSSSFTNRQRQQITNV